jgi:hypothetical protein
MEMFELFDQIGITGETVADRFVILDENPDMFYPDTADVREQIIDYMYNNTGWSKDDMVSEIERYIVMPGQALSYQVGMMHIRDLRSKAESGLGDAFDLAEFHDVVLMNGALPLEILSGVVESWVNGKLN